MTAHLQGRALDEACARAMGTYVDECEGGYAEVAGNSCDGWFCDGCGSVWGRWGEPMPKHAKVRAYSTDPHTQGEMLAWLRAVDGYEWASIDIDEDAIGSGEVAAYVWIHNEPSSGFGTTINEALARLVVAVAEREAGR